MYVAFGFLKIFDLLSLIVFFVGWIYLMLYFLSLALMGGMPYVFLNLYEK